MLHLPLVLLAALAAAVSAFPAALQPRACTFVNWDGLYVLDEARPNDYLPSNYLFSVSQQAGTNGGRATARKYLLVHYPATPAGSYGCQLHWVIPASTSFLNSTGSSKQLDVKSATAVWGSAPAPVRPTWNSVVPALQGTVGTVNAVPDVNAVVNSVVCSNVGGGNGNGLAFVFKFADWVEQAGGAAAVAFYGGYTGPGVFRGPYLEYNC